MKFILQLICFLIHPVSHTKVSHLPPPSQNNFELPLLYTHQHSLSVYIFLNSEPQLFEPKEINNKEINVNRAFKYFLSTYKNEKADRLCMKFSSNLKRGGKYGFLYQNLSENMKMTLNLEHQLIYISYDLYFFQKS